MWDVTTWLDGGFGTNPAFSAPFIIGRAASADIAAFTQFPTPERMRLALLTYDLLRNSRSVNSTHDAKSEVNKIASNKSDKHSNSFDLKLINHWINK